MAVRGAPAEAEAIRSNQKQSEMAVRGAPAQSDAIRRTQTQSEMAVRGAPAQSDAIRSHQGGARLLQGTLLQQEHEDDEVVGGEHAVEQEACRVERRLPARDRKGFSVVGDQWKISGRSAEDQREIGGRSAGGRREVSASRWSGVACCHERSHHIAPPPAAAMSDQPTSHAVAETRSILGHEPSHWRSRRTMAARGRLRASHATVVYLRRGSVGLDLAWFGLGWVWGWVWFGFGWVELGALGGLLLAVAEEEAGEADRVGRDAFVEGGVTDGHLELRRSSAGDQRGWLSDGGRRWETV